MSELYKLSELQAENEKLRDLYLAKNRELEAYTSRVNESGNKKKVGKYFKREINSVRYDKNEFERTEISVTNTKIIFVERQDEKSALIHQVEYNNVDVGFSYATSSVKFRDSYLNLFYQEITKEEARKLTEYLPFIRVFK